MKKDGFVLIESIVVLVVVALSLAMLFSSYSLVARKTKEKEYYNRASDKYLLYVISSLGTDDNCNYSKVCPTINANFIDFQIKTDMPNGGSTITNCTQNNKTNGLMYDCDKLFKDFKLEYLYVVSDVKAALNSSDAVSKYDNGTLEYMKSLKKCNDTNEYYEVPDGVTTNTTSRIYYNGQNSTSCNNPIRYMIGVFKRSETDFYYASIEI